MSDVHGITPGRMLAVRERMRRFLRDVAPQAWAWQMRTGEKFVVPSMWARLPVEEQARRLADAEDRRLEAATCWHLDSGCVEAAMRWAMRLLREDYSLSREDVPSTAGLMVWAEHISPEAYSGRVVAAHWCVEDDGVWMAWWTDKETSLPEMAAVHGVTVAEMRGALAEFGDLLYDRERLLPIGQGSALQGPPDREQEPAVVQMTAIIIASWKLLREGRVAVHEVDEMVRAVSLPPGSDAASWG